MMKPASIRFLAALFLSAAGFAPRGQAAGSPVPDEVLSALVLANDRLVELELASSEPRRGGAARAAGARLMILAAAFTHPDSGHHHQGRLVPAMEAQVAALQRAQNPSGLWDSGNLDSPPDSAFVLKTLARTQHFLTRDRHASTASLRDALKRLILACAEGVRRGGVHTPNHRWAICSALAHVHQLYPDSRYTDRIDAWLAEGIDVDADGLWAERSSNYTSDVNNPAMVELAILLDRPALLDPVRRSLDASLYLFETDGEVDTTASRRQDQRGTSRQQVWEYYFPYRYLAIRDDNRTYAAVARWIERDFLPELGADAANMSSPMTSMLMFPELTGPLPAAGTLPNAFVKVYAQNALARIRRGKVSATVFGGSDWYQGLGYGSGLSTNPTFFKLRKGRAILESVRMTPSFFSAGFFYSQGLRTERNTYTLWQDLPVPYHQPLPPEHRRRDGQYVLQADMAKQGMLGRFFSKMSFADRPKQFVTLNSRVHVTESDGTFQLNFEVDGPPGVGVTIELCFRSGGDFTGVTPGAGDDGLGAAGASRNRGGPLTAEDLAKVHLLKEGWATYTVGDDRLDFGPGSYTRPPGRMEGEALTWVGGSLRPDGDRVYLTGVTPFRHTLTFR